MCLTYHFPQYLRVGLAVILKSRDHVRNDNFKLLQQLLRMFIVIVTLALYMCACVLPQPGCILTGTLRGYGAG